MTDLYSEQNSLGNWATRDEVDRAIEGLAPQDVRKLRRFADRRAWLLGRTWHGWTGSDLFAEAIHSTLEGAKGGGIGRRWNKDVDFVRHLTLAMKGISYRWATECKAEIALECDIITCDFDGQKYSPLDDCPSGEATAERSLIATEQLDRIFVKYGDDGKTIEVLQGLWTGMTTQEIMQKYHLTASALKRIRRRLARGRAYGGERRRYIRSAQSHHGHPPVTDINAAPQKALVVHDYKVLLRLLALKLKQLGYTMRTTCDVEEGLRLYRQSGPFKIVLIDYDLPKGEGLELAMAMLKINASQKIIITAFDYAAAEEVPLPPELAHIPILLGPLKSDLNKVLERFQHPSGRPDENAQGCVATQSGDVSAIEASASQPEESAETRQTGEDVSEGADSGNEAPVGAEAELPNPTAEPEAHPGAKAC
jgi:CheY-like chemotaxis protein